MFDTSNAISQKLTDNFLVSEFLVSDSWPNLAAGLTLTYDEKMKFFLLATFGLEKVRERFGVVRILSGKRSDEMNRLCNGKKTSQHLVCEATDIICPEMEIQGPVYEFLDPWWPGQLFYYQKRNFVHLALPRWDVVSMHRIEK